MDDLLKILLRAQLDTKNLASNINSQLKQVENKINKINVDIRVKDSDALKAIEKVNKAFAKLNQLDSANGIKNISANIDIATKNIKDFETINNKTFLDAGGVVTKYTETIKQAGIAITETFSDIEKKNHLGTVFDDKSMEYNTQQTLKAIKERTKLEQDYENWWLKSLKNKELQEDQISRKNIENISKERQAREDMYKQMFIQLEQQEAKTQQSLNLFKQKMLGGDGFTGELDIFAGKQKGRFDENALAKIKSDIASLTVTTPNLNNEIKKLSTQFNSLRQNASQSGSVISRTLENMTKFMRFYLAGGVLVRVISEIRSGVESVKMLDASLTELSKVSDLTTSQLAEFTDRAYEAGRTIGRTGKEVIDATSEFKRAGYEIESAFELSQQALLLTNIGDGINDVKEASSSLIAILKGFKMEASETSHVVDALNEVSNNYAVDTNNLTEIMKRASGTIGQTGTSYEQLLGLATGGYESLRNAEMVASGKMFCPYVQKCA